MELPDISQPAIVITVDPDADRRSWRQLLLGMEEEGIPFVLHRVERGNGDTSPVTLAHQAASASPLAVGVAVGARELVVHDPHLPADGPLFVLEDYPRLAAEEIRRLGCNAARLVKGLPFKFTV
ncbi:glycerol dehydratase reactivase beta/small subunit family protein [Sodalis sp. RH21]|uniref:glycerol dehydratase reactivase beta/small subunit family protein n=1 Tax=unclassified Sodalis (in: enterobacteria) TaxID=2636512 RepID=UPI0039B55074